MKSLKKPLFLFFAITFLSFGTARAQMFSVQEDETADQTVPTTHIYLGIEPATFDYQGDPALANAGIFEFDASIIRARLETGTIDFSMGIGGEFTGMDDLSYFDLSLSGGQQLTLVRNEGLLVQLPLQLKTTLTSVTNKQFGGTGSQFQQGTLEIGGGGSLQARLAENIRIEVEAIPSFGFSFATGGTFGGSIIDIGTKLRLHFDRLFGNIGVSTGWDYSFDRFNIEEDEFDYDLDTNSFILGITF